MGGRWKKRSNNKLILTPEVNCKQTELANLFEVALNLRVYILYVLLHQ